MKLRLATRRSPLARAQAGLAARALATLPEVEEVEIVPLATTGDRLRGDLRQAGGKGLFTRELEAALEAGSVDLAVHSLKDVPTTLSPGFCLAAFLPRGPVADLLISSEASDLAGLPRGAVVLTGSARRHALVLEERPDLRVLPLRGNLDTRLRRWRSSGAAGVILAAAGLSRLDRLGAGGLPAHELPPARFLPAVGQGTLVLQGLGDAAPALLAGSVDDPQARASGEAERWLADRAGADCHDAFAAWVRPQPTGGWRASAWRAASTGPGPRADAEAEDAMTAARSCADRLLGGTPS